MGVCETYENSKKKSKKSNKGNQPFHAPIHSSKNIFNVKNTHNSVSQIDIPITQVKPIPLYKYNSVYGKKEDQTTLVTGSLHEMQGNSLMNLGSRNSREITSLEETMNESSDVIEIISNGKVDKERVKQSKDKSTIDNYIEFIDNEDNSISNDNNKFDMYNKKYDRNDINKNKKKNYQ